MSWSVSIYPVPAEKFLEELEKADFSENTPAEDRARQQDQLDEAKQLARHLFESGAIGHGTDDTLIGFSLSGHAVNNHTLDQSWTFEGVYVGVNRQYRPTLEHNS